MNLSKHVIRDLLPAYVAGEASADTRALVESALAGDAELRAEAAMIGTVPAALIGTVPATPPAGLGMDTLKRTQRLLRRRTLLAGVSVFFSTLPLALLDRPWILAGRLGAGACLLAAAAGWALFLKNAMRLHAAGLEGPRSRSATYAWYGATAVFSLSVLICVQDWTGLDIGRWMTILVVLFWIPVLWFGRRTRQLPDEAEIRQVESLVSLARDHDDSVKSRF
jgi:hypothetical protein